MIFVIFVIRMIFWRSATIRVLAISSDQIPGTNASESTIIANMELA